MHPPAIYPLKRAASIFPERWVSAPDGRVTYREMHERVGRTAGLLRSLGVSRGDVVAVMDVNSIRFMELAYAASLVNAVLFPVNFRLPPVILRELFKVVEPKIVFYSSPFKELAGVYQDVERVELEKYEDLISGSEPVEGEPDPEAPYVLLTTSGTTGMPKLVLYQQYKMVLGALSIAHQLSLYETPARLGSGDTMLSLIPVFHILSWGSVFIAPYIGARLVFVDKFDPSLVVSKIREEGVTWINGVPTMMYMLLQTGEKFNGMKALIGGSPITSSLARSLREAGVRFSMIYGATDMLATSISIITDHTREDDVTRVTHPVPMAEVKIVDLEGRELPPGSIGEIVYRSPWMPDGYYKNPEKTREAFRDGWFHTGDIGMMTRDGGLIILDRIKDAVKSGGEWIPTSVLESIISEVPGVEMVAVIGVRHEKWGERPVAVIKGTATPEQVKRHLEEAAKQGRIAKWWIPDKIYYTSEMPLTSTGKIDKKLLRQRYQE